jgi:hypothetical protein
MDRLREMADKMSECSQCLGQGKVPDAEQQLGQLAGDLDQMQKELDELELIDDAFDQIAEAKNALNCQKCQGAGCMSCQGSGIEGKGPPGRGMGKGQGAGDRPEEESDANFYQSRVRGRVQQGKGIVVDSVPGRNLAGKARETIKDAIESPTRDAADPLTGHRLPKALRTHAQQYFDAVREGKK